MKTKLFILLLITSTFHTYSQQIISTNTTWSGNVFLSQKVIVRPGATLTILPNTVVSIGFLDVDGNGTGDVQLVVNGKLKVMASDCNPVKFKPYSSTTSNKYWTGIIINSNVANDSISGISITHADTAINVKTETTITSANIDSFGTFGIFYTPTIQGTELNLNNTIISNGTTGVFADSLGSTLNLDWCSIDSCINGLVAFNGHVVIKSSRVQNSSRLGMALMDGEATLQNSLFRKNYAFGIINSSGSLNAINCQVDSNSLGGICLAGTSSNNLSFLNLTNNYGSQLEITDIKIYLNCYATMGGTEETAPIISTNNSNIISNSISTFYDVKGLFELVDFSFNNPTYWDYNFTCGGNANYFSGEKFLGNTKVIAGRLTKWFTYVKASGCCPVNAPGCGALEIIDFANNQIIGSFGACGVNSIACLTTDGISTSVTSNKIKKIRLRSYYYNGSPGGGAVSIKYPFTQIAYCTFGGYLVYDNTLGVSTTSFNFQNNNFNQSTPGNYFYNPYNNINFTGFTVFPITNAGLAMGQNLLQGTSFPTAFLGNNNNNRDTVCGSLANFRLIAPSIVGASYNWYYNGNLFQTTTSNSYQIPVAGQWSCQINSPGCVIQTGVRNIVLQSAPTVNISGNASVCQGQSVTLNATGANSYVWSNGDITSTTSFTPSTNSTLSVTGTANGCQTVASVPVVVNPLPLATINPSPSAILCSGSQIQLTASGGTNYTWSNGATGTSVTITTAGAYTVTATSAAGCSATSAPTTIVTVAGINVSVSPSATTVCNGQSVTMTASGATSYSWSNGATGASITVTPNQTTTYTVTGTGNSNCTSSATSTITVNSGTTPSFSTFGPYCAGATAPSLPATSNNGINGSWNPSTVSTSSAGSTTYTFTPAAGQCANSTSTTIVVNPTTTPIFNSFGPYCQGTTPAILPSSSNNGISGTWNPSNISTTTPGSSVYTFTPAAGGCNSIVTTNVTVSANTTPSFSTYGPYCVGANAPVLPTSSNNGISGAWSPPSINTNSIGTTTYTFTPDQGQCAISSSINISVGATINPVFSSIGQYCLGSNPITLPITSDNGISGVWSPSTTNTTTPGIFTYSFTPNVGQCSNTTANLFQIEILQYPTTPLVSVGGSTSLCPGDSVLLTSSSLNNNIWSNGETTNSIFVSSPGNYSVSVNNQICSVSSTSVLISSQPGVSIVNNPTNQTVVQGNSTYFTVSTSNFNTTYQWQIDNGNGFINLTNGSQFSGVTNDTLYLSNAQLSDNNSQYRCICTNGSCTDTSAIATLIVDINTISFHSNYESLIDIIPNPFETSFIVRVSQNLIGSPIFITSLLGEKVYDSTLTAENTSIDLGGISQGLYFVKIHQAKNIHILKLIRK